VEELLNVILPENEQILIVAGKYYQPSTLLIPCHSAGSCPTEAYGPANHNRNEACSQHSTIVCCMPIAMKGGTNESSLTPRLRVAGSFSNVLVENSCLLLRARKINVSCPRLRPLFKMLGYPRSVLEACSNIDLTA